MRIPEWRRRGGGGAVQVFDGQIGATADDGWSDSNGAFFTNNIRIGKWNNFARDGFARWTNITIPPGATIDVAYLTIQIVDSGNDGADVLTDIFFEDSDDAVAPTSQAEHAADVRTTAFTAWDGQDFTENIDIDSPSIVNIIQEIVDRGSWVSGNAMMVLWDDGATVTNNKVYAPYDYTNNSAKAMKLHVEYTT